MHKQYAKDGLAAISVSMDDPSEKETKGKVLKFLESKKAGFENYILDEPPEVWTKKLDFESLPCVFVFDREGKRVKQFKDEEFTYRDVEKVVLEELKKK